MMQALVDAKDELKRVDHQIFVSLKHTRTCDVLRNVIARMIEAYEFMIEALLKLAVEQSRLPDTPASKIERASLVKDLYDAEDVLDNLDLYFLLRKIHKDETFKRDKEYRRHVTMTSYIDGREELINIDIITNYYHLQRKMFDFVEKLILQKWNEGKVVPDDD
ncbi:MAG: hypothetical protein HC945_00630 [Nitrosarchaeum sp.]|nr:hypothetical protein [Nitrosarchaeum sp.]